MFMGTPELAAAALAGLYEAGYELPLVVTQPDRVSGRGRQAAFSPVKAYAYSKGLRVDQPDSLRTKDTIYRIREAEPEVIVVAAFGMLLPAPLLDMAPLGCLNIHTSLLPAYRGAAPIQWALLNGEGETGVTIMRMDEGLDTGPILMQEKLAIPEDMDYGELYNALSSLGARLLLDVLPQWAKGGIQARSQNDDGASYVAKLTRKHEIIDWSCSSDAIRNQIRAFSPSPGASTGIGGKEIKVLQATRISSEEQSRLCTEVQEHGVQALPGQIAAILRRHGPVVATGDGFLLLTKVQPAGKKAMDAWSWLNGSRLSVGQAFG
ncbi:MAG: methionyl-tRNA formyltransferase [Clostridiales bacterium]|nr:methionyl-tRNA formyltransferase [Clostridiales bacterium]